jgi:tetratricopeptide (TPR) repeat protein
MLKRIAVVAVLVLAHAGSAYAQNTAQAEDLFDQGRAEMDAKNYDKACKLFEQSLKLDKAPVTQLNLAKCYEAIGKVASAWALYTEVGDILQQDDPELAKIARDGAVAMKPRLPRLEVKTADAGATIDVDGQSWSAGVATAIDPGKHVVTVKAEGKKTWTGEATTEEGKTATLEVPALEDAPVEVPIGGGGGAPVKKSKTLKYVGYGAVGAGGVGLVLGTVFGLSAKSSRDAAIDGGCMDDLSGCPTAALPDAQDAYDSANRSTLFFIAGGVLAAGGVVMILLSPSDEKAASGATSWQVTPSVGPDLAGMILTGTF